MSAPAQIQSPAAAAALPAVKVDGVWKKYARSFRRGVLNWGRDFARGVLGREPLDALRPGEFWSLANLSFELRRGECLGVIGPNGAGKSTLLKILSGIVEPTRGSVELRGRVGSLIELGAGFHPDLTGRENVYVYGAILGLSRRELDARFDEIVAFADIGEFLDAPVRFYSSGMYVRLAFAVAAHTDPDVLLVDEVLAVGDVNFRMKCYRKLLELMHAGASIVLVSHATQVLSRMARRVLVLAKGRALFDGELSEGVSLYESLQLAREPQGRPANPANPAGCRIDAVRLCNDAGEPREAFKTGETLVAEIDLAADRPVPGARLIAHLESSLLGRLGGFGTPHTGFEFELAPPGAAVRLALPRLPLLVGAYQLHLGLAGADPGELLDHRWPAATFRVDGPPIDAFGFGLSGTLAFEHRWETRAQAAAPTAQGLWPAPRPLRLVCNSWPKAGTHLLQEVAKGLLGEGTWYRQAELIHPPGGEPVLLDALQAKFEAAGERGAVLGHFPWSPALERAFLDRGWKTLFIIRDPRDMLCSTLRWMLDLRPDWAISRHMRELPGDDARLAAIIAGLPVLAPLHRNVDVAWDKPLPHRLERLTPWTSSAHACTLRFEDLLGGPDEDARRRQEAELRRALEYLGDDGRVPLAELARGLFNPLSATFHSAQRGTWRRYFKPEHRALFLETGGEELVRRFGYPPTEAGEQP